MKESDYIKATNKARLADVRNILADVMNTKEYGIKEPKKFKAAFNEICQLIDSFDLNLTDE